MYHIGTLKTPVEVLEFFEMSVANVFQQTEVLSLRNICGEGISLTHGEWDFMAEGLAFFPRDLSAFLLEGCASDLTPLLEILLRDFVVWQCYTHPETSNIRLLNKILSLLQDCSPFTYKSIIDSSKTLLLKIEKSIADHYATLVSPDILASANLKIKRIQQNLNPKKQSDLTGLPKWWNVTVSSVDELFVAQLLMNKRSNNPLSLPKSEKPQRTELQAIKQLTEMFQAECIIYFACCFFLWFVGFGVACVLYCCNSCLDIFLVLTIS